MSDTQTNTDCSLFECALSGCEEGQQDIRVCAVYTKVRKCESHATEAHLIWFLPNLLHVCPAALHTCEGMMAEKKNLKIGWKKSKEHITDFLEIMRFFSILWVTSLSGNPPEIYSGQIHHMNTMRRGPMSASERAHHPRGRSRNTSSWGLVLHDYVYVCLHLCLYWQSTGWDWEVTGIEEVAMVSIFEVGKWG